MLISSFPWWLVHKITWMSFDKILKIYAKFHSNPVKSLISLSPLGFLFIVTSDSLCLQSLSPCASSSAGLGCCHPLIPQSWTPSPDTFSFASELCFLTHFILQQPVHLQGLRQQVTSDFRHARKPTHELFSCQKWGDGGDTEHLEIETLSGDPAAA